MLKFSYIDRKCIPNMGIFGYFGKILDFSSVMLYLYALNLTCNYEV